MDQIDHLQIWVAADPAAASAAGVTAAVAVAFYTWDKLIICKFITIMQITAVKNGSNWSLIIRVAATPAAASAASVAAVAIWIYFAQSQRY